MTPTPIAVDTTTILSRRDPALRMRRGVVVGGLVLVTAAAWAYLFLLDARMGDMESPLAVPMTARWTAGDALLMWTMWVVMMAGMMLPSSAPMVDAYTRIVRSRAAAIPPSRSADGSPAAFVAGYLVVWSVFAGAATAAQWFLHDATLVTAMGESTGGRLAGALLVAAGVYQFTPFKDACLRQCRTPLGFLTAHWRPGRDGALTMGLRHGTLCVGCCWALMALLFVLGVMNLWWIGVLAAAVLAEKVIRHDWPTRFLGGTLIAWGVAVFLSDIA